MKIVLTMTSPTVPKEREQQYHRIIKHLEKHNEPLLLSELAARTGIKKAYLWVLINELIKQGQVVIQRFPREGSTLHGYLPSHVVKYTTREKAEPKAEPENTADREQPEPQQRAPEDASTAYNEGYKDGCRAVREKEMPVNVTKARGEGFEAGMQHIGGLLLQLLKNCNVIDTEDKQ